MSYLILLETSGNQAYLFSTNKLRENVGASELTWCAGTHWVLDAVKKAGGEVLWDDDLEKMRINIGRGQVKNGIEVVVATSGKAILIVDKKKSATDIVDTVTRRALKEAPGLDIFGAVVDYDPNRDCIHNKIKEVHECFNQRRGERAGPLLRHLLLPIVDLCASSGRPAADIEHKQNGQSLSLASLHKRKAAPNWTKRLQGILRRQGKAKEAIDLWFPDNLSQMENQFEELDWLAVVHVDGNGLGQTFLSFDEHCGTKDDPAKNKIYINALRAFSLELDRANEAAFIAACATLSTTQGTVRGRPRDISPIVPLVLGGDDLTVMVDGRYALAFTVAFLRAFECETGKRPALSEIAKKAISHACFGAGAGVAIVKSHFPFHSAYELAESLLKSAKQVKIHLGSHGSALDFHILNDSSFTSLVAIRERLTQGDTYLTAGPYVVSEATTDWAKTHALDDLLDRVKAINRRDPESDRHDLPNGQLHALRGSLFYGETIANAHLNKLMGRYGDFGLKTMCENETTPYTLFRSHHEGAKRETRFLEAIESAIFWEDASHSEQNDHV